MNAPLASGHSNTGDLSVPRLFSSLQMGDMTLANRVVMAPLTRCRADEAAGDIPGSAMNIAYYVQRATAGLIVSEGTQVDPAGKGYRATPGIYSAEQVRGWRKITDAVHEAGGRIVAQLWHVGRVTHPLVNGGRPSVAPSAIAPAIDVYTSQGKMPAPVPHALTVSEIAEVVAAFRRGAANAMAAGFDGVEIHGANGYLIDQFLRDGANQRDDAYGGTPERRLRLPLEIVDAVVAEAGAGRTGIRLAPVTPANDLRDSDPQTVFGQLLEALNERGLAFVHFVEGATGGARDVPGFDFDWARRTWKGVYLANNGYDRQMAIEAVEQGRADAVAFGRLFIANPDLVHRLRVNAPLNAPNPQLFYTPGPEGYTDYSALPL